MLTPTGVTVQDYISSINSDNPIHVKLVFSSQGITLDDQDIDISKRLVLEDIMNGDTDIAFGKAVMKQLTVGILNSNRVSSLVWTDEFDLEIGVDINGTTNYVKVGTFIGKQPQSINISKVINFTATDRMVKFDTLADDFFEAITYPTTVQDIYDDLCTFVGVTNVSGNELANIMSRSYAEAVFDMAGYTCRDILSWIAEACGCYAKINANGNVQMVWFTDHTSDVSIDDDYEFDFDCADDTITAIDRLNIKQVGSDVDVDYPDDTGVNTYRIINNPFLSVSDASDVTTYIKPIYDRLDAFGVYLPSMVRCVGNWLVETGDIIEADINGSTVSMPVFARTLVFNGNIEDTYEATGNKSRDVYASDSDKQKVLTAKQIELIVGDKYYERKSGITIDTNGVRIFGSNELRIDSGGSIDINSNNFIVDSANRKMVSGYWTFNDNGVVYAPQDTDIPFEIADLNNIGSHTLGFYYHKALTATGRNDGSIHINAAVVNNNDVFCRGGVRVSVQTDIPNLDKLMVTYLSPIRKTIDDSYFQLGGGVGGHFDIINANKILYYSNDPLSESSYVGTSNYPYHYGYIHSLISTYVGAEDGHNLFLYADSNNHRVALQLYEEVSNNKQYLYLLKSNDVDYLILQGSASLNVAKSGDTMTGNLSVIKAAQTFVSVKDSNTSCNLYLMSDTDGKHGLWSSGYYNGSSYTTSGKWLIYRGTDGGVTVNGSCTGSSGSCTGNAATATKLSANASNTSASFWRGDNAWSSTLTNVLTLYREGTTAQDYPAGISLSNKDTTTGKTYNGAYVYAYQDHGSTPYGQNLVINSGGNTVIGAGESAGSLYSAKLVGNTSENMYVLADGTTYVYANANTVANRIGFAVNTSGHILPQKAEAANNNAQNLGASDNKWANVYATTFNGALSGNATTATTATTASNFKSTNNAGWQTDQYGSIKHQRSTSTDYLCVMTSGATEKVKIYYETGNIETAGNITISHATSADMSAGSANPKITFSEGGSQPVHLIYTDYDSYRSPAGLKVVGGASATPAWFEVEGEIYASKVHNAVWNDYAECRKVETLEPGRCVTETESGTMAVTTKRLQPGCKITSDTFGSCMGETAEAKTPIAVAGRVLVYPYKNRKHYHVGDAVCSAPNGTVDVMTRREIKKYPERIVGIVSEIPTYDKWQGGSQQGHDDIEVNGRIWVYVR